MCQIFVIIGLSSPFPALQEKLSQTVNMRAMNMLGKAEEKVQHASFNFLFCWEGEGFLSPTNPKVIIFI